MFFASKTSRFLYFPCVSVCTSGICMLKYYADGEKGMQRTNILNLDIKQSKLYGFFKNAVLLLLFYFRQKLRSVRQSFQRGFRPHGGGGNDVRFAVRAQRAGTFLFRGQSRRCRSRALHGYFQRVQGDFRVRSQRAEFGCEICRKACRRLR